MTFTTRTRVAALVSAALASFALTGCATSSGENEFGGVFNETAEDVCRVSGQNPIDESPEFKLAGAEDSTTAAVGQLANVEDDSVRANFDHVFGDVEAERYLAMCYLIPADGAKDVHGMSRAILVTEAGDGDSMWLHLEGPGY